MKIQTQIEKNLGQINKYQVALLIQSKDQD